MRVIASVVLFCCAQSVSAQSCFTSPKDRWQVDRHGGTVTQVSSDLQWQRCSYGQNTTPISCQGRAEKMTYRQAQQLEKAQVDGWRLPTISEMAQLLAHECASPSIALTVFPNTPSHLYWTQSHYIPNQDRMWTINFESGLVMYTRVDRLNHVRWVRDRPS